MKLLILISIILLLSFKSFGQDVIYLKNNEQLKAKVTLIEDKSVFYKKFENLNGPEYEIAKKEITIIVYENGTSEQFNASTSPENNAKNVISFNFGDLVVSRISLSYERFIYNQKLSIKVPFAMSYNYGYYSNQPKLMTGLDFNFYPLGLKKVSYFTGIGSQVGILNQYIYYYDYVGPQYPGGYYYNNSQKYFIGAYLNNGITVIPIENFSISGQIGVGFRDIEGPYLAQPSVIGQLNVSVRF